MFDPIAPETAKTETRPQGRATPESGVEDGSDTFAQVFDVQGQPKLVLEPPADAIAEPETGEENTPAPDDQTEQDVLELTFADSSPPDQDAMKHRFGRPKGETVNLETPAQEKTPLSVQTTDGGPESQAQTEPTHSAQAVPMNQDVPRNGSDTPTIPTTTTQQTTPAPHADGSKGPTADSTPAEDSTMQLSRPNRLRSYPAALHRMASSESAQLPPTSDAELDPPPVRAPLITGQTTRDQTGPDARYMRGESGQSNGPNQKGANPSWHTTPAEHRTVAPTEMRQTLPAKPVSHNIFSTDVRPSTPPPSPPPVPQVLAAYTSLAPRNIPTPEISPAAIPDSGSDALMSRSFDSHIPIESARVGAKMPSVTPEQLAPQLAQIAQNANMQRRDILLNPEELGRIRMNVQAQETSVHVAILVERPETLDLMRRYIGQLATEFRALGYRDVSFEFTQNGNGGAEAKHPTPEQAQPATETLPDDNATPAAPPPQRAAHIGTLDLRI